MTGGEFLKGINNQNQVFTRVVEHNTANADEEKYHELKVVRTADPYVGSRIEGIESKMESVLQDELYDKNSEVAYNKALRENLQKITKFFGSPRQVDSDVDYHTALNDAITQLFKKIGELDNAPGDAQFKEGLIEQVRESASIISGIARNLQDLRMDLDSKIAEYTQELNSNLNLAYEQNKVLPVLKTGDTVKYYDAVNNFEETLSKISELIDIRRHYNQKGLLMLDTKSGLPLMSDFKYQANYQHQPGMKTYLEDGMFTPLSLVAVKTDGSKVDYPNPLITGGRSDEIQHKISGGKLAALFQLRDKIIPSVLDSLDKFAAIFASKMNDIYRDNTVYSGFDSMVGQKDLNPQADLYGTGHFKIAVLGPDGKAAQDDAGNNLPMIDIDLDKINPSNHDFSLSKFIAFANDAVHDSLESHVEFQGLYDIGLFKKSEAVAGLAPGATRDLKFALDVVNPSESDVELKISNVEVKTLKGTTQVGTVTPTVTGSNFTVDAGKALNSSTRLDIDLLSQLNNSQIKNGDIDNLEISMKVTISGKESTITYKVPLAKDVNPSQRTFHAKEATGDASLVTNDLEENFLQFSAVDEKGAEVTNLATAKSAYLKIASSEEKYRFVVVGENANFDNNIASFIENNKNKQPVGFKAFFEENNLFIYNSEDSYNTETHKNAAYALEVNGKILNSRDFAAARMEFNSVKEMTLNPQEKNAFELLKDYWVTPDSKDGLDKLTVLGSESVTFAESALLPETTASFSYYVSNLMGQITSKTKSAKEIEDKSRIECEAVLNKIQSKSGVSVDEQILNLVDFNRIYQGCLKTYKAMQEMDEQFFAVI